jgi:hypothetical protein
MMAVIKNIDPIVWAIYCNGRNEESDDEED